MTPLTRRELLALLASLPAATAAHAQFRPTGAHRVSIGAWHGLLLSPDGTVRVWHTQLVESALDAIGLGPGSPLAPHTLAAVPGLTGLAAAAAGPATSFAVGGDGRLYAWGLNAGNGLLGTTSRQTVETSASWGPNSNVPVVVPLGVAASAVSCGGDHVLALGRDGTIRAWGRGDKGQLGVGPLPVINFKTRTPAAMTFVPFPMPVPDLSGVTAIAAGPAHSLALLDDGTVRAWGDNRWGQIGDGTTTSRDRPVPVPGLRDVVGVATGGTGFSLALLADGAVMAWGNTSLGTMGRAVAGPRDVLATPSLVPGVRDVRALAAGGSHVLALTAAGAVISWGDDTFGALGRATDGRTTAAPVPGLTGVQQVAAAGATSVAVLASGRIVTWGIVRPWTRPEPTARADISRSPILLWIDGLNQP